MPFVSATVMSTVAVPLLVVTAEGRFVVGVRVNVRLLPVPVNTTFVLPNRFEILWLVTTTVSVRLEIAVIPEDTVIGTEAEEFSATVIELTGLISGANVWMFNNQPWAMAPVSGALSSYTYNDQTPFGFVLLNTFNIWP